MTYSINGITENDIEMELNRLANLPIGGASCVRVPVCITIDLSGSMDKHYEMVKNVVKNMCEQLSVVNKREFTLILVIIYRSVPRLVYFGDLHNFDYYKFECDLPDECYGTTPLNKSFEMAKDVMESLETVLAENNHYRTIPVFFSVTDSQATDSTDDCSSITEEFKNDITQNKKILVEFVTSSNSDGLNLGGYKVPIDKKDSEKKVKEFMQCLKNATSTQANMEDAGASRIPPRRLKDKYNQYMSNIMLVNLKFCYKRSQLFRDDKF